MLYFTIVLSAQYQKTFVPKCNKPDRENVEIQKKDWREKLIWGSIFLLSLPSVSGGQGEFGLQSLGRKVTVKEATCGRSNNLVDIPCVISPLCKTYCSILGIICAEQRWWGGKEKNRTEMGELCKLKGTYQLLRDRLSCWIWPAGEADDFLKTGESQAGVQRPWKKRLVLPKCDTTMDLMNGTAIHCIVNLALIWGCRAHD